MAEDKYSYNRQLAYDLLKKEGYTDIGNSADELFKDRRNGEIAYNLLSKAGYTDIGKDYNEFSGMIYAPEKEAPRQSESQRRTSRFNEMARQRDAARGYVPGQDTPQDEAAAKAVVEKRKQRVADLQAPAENPFPYRGGLENEIQDLEKQLEAAKGDSAFVDEYEARRKGSKDRDIMSMGANPFGTSVASEDDKWLLENEERYARAKGDKAKADEIAGQIAQIHKAENAIEDRKAREEIRKHLDPQQIIATGSTALGNDNAGGRFAQESEIAEWRAADDLMAMADQENDKGSRYDSGYEDNPVGTAIAQFVMGGINNVDKGSLTMGLSEGTTFQKVRDAAEKKNGLIDKAMADLGYDEEKVNALMKSAEDKMEAYQAVVGDLKAAETELKNMETTLEDLAESGDDGRYRAYYNKYKKKYDEYAKRLKSDYEPLRATFDEYEKVIGAIQAAAEDGLTDGEKAVLDAFGRYTRAKGISAQLESNASKAGSGFEQSLEFILDFALTKGLGKAGTKTATKIAAKKLARELGEDVAKGVVAKPGLGLQMATDAVTSAARTALMFPRNLAAYGEQLTAMDKEGSGVDNLGRYTFDRSRANALVNTALTQYIEYWSEGFGEYFGAGEQALFKQVAGRAPATAIGKTLKNYRGSIGKYLDYGKFDGMFNEMMEEVVGSTFNSLAGWMSGDRVGDKEAMKEFFAGDNLSTLFFSFLPLSTIGAVSNMKSYKKMMDRYNEGVSVLNPIISSNESVRKDLDDLTARLADMTPVEIKDKVVEITDKARKGNGGELPNNFAQGLMGYLEGTFALKLESDTWGESAEKVSVANAYAQQYDNPNAANAWALNKNEQVARDAAIEAGFTEEELDKNPYMLAQQSTAMKELEPERARALYDYAEAKASAEGLKDGYDSESEDEFRDFENAVRSSVYVNGSVTTANLGGRSVYITSEDADVHPDGTVTTPTGSGEITYREAPYGELKHAKANLFSEAKALPLIQFVNEQRDAYYNYREQVYDALQNTISPEGQIAEVNNHVGHEVFLRGSGAYERVRIERTTSNGANAVISGDKEALKAVATAAGIQSPGGSMLEVPIRNLYPLLAREEDGSLTTEANMPSQQQAAKQAPAAQQQINPRDLLGTPQTIRFGGQERNVFVTSVERNGDVWFEYEGPDGRTRRASLPYSDFFNAMQAVQAPAQEEAQAPAAEQEQAPAAAEEAAPAQEAAPEADFRGNPIPMKDGKVDQETFRETDPEAWARWADALPEGDERKPSLGTMKRLQGIANAAKKAVEKAQKELEKLYDEGASDEKIQAKERELRTLTARQNLYDTAVANFSNPAPVAEAAAPAAAVEEQAPAQAEAPAAEEPAPAPAEETVKEEPAPATEEEAPAEEPQTEAPQARIADEEEAPEAKAEEKEEAERQRPLKEKIGQWEKRTGVPAVAIESFDQVTNRAARREILSGKRVTGWYDKDTGKVYMYLPNCRSEKEVDKTYIHEVIAHKGLPGLLGKRGWNSLMDSVWKTLGPAQQFRWIGYPSVKNMKNVTLKAKQRAAADEFVAHLAENIDTNVSAWKRFVARLKEVLLRLGIKVNLTNEDLAAIVGRSLARFERMTARGKADAAVKDEISTDIGGGIQVNGDEDNQVQFSVRSIATGAGLTGVASNMKGDVVFTTDDGRTFDAENPARVSDLKSIEDSALSYMMRDARTLGKLTGSQEEAIWQAYADQINSFLAKGVASNGLTGFDKLSATWEWEVANSVYKSVATNGDAQYLKSIDITRVCKKNEAVIKAISEMQNRLGFGITPGQIMDIYLSGIEEGYQVPCPVCYVFSHYLNNGKYATIAVKGQRKYGQFLVDPSTLSEEEKEAKVQEWLDRLRDEENFNDANAAAIEAARNDLSEVEEEINRISKRLTYGEVSDEERKNLMERASELDAQYRAALDLYSTAGLDQWIKQFAIREVTDNDAPKVMGKDGKMHSQKKWVLWEDSFQEFPEQYALDLRLTAETIEKYPAIQRLRKSGGSAAGKEIHFASNNDIGDIPMMLGASSLSEAKNYYKMAADEYNPSQKEKYLKQAAEKFAAARKYAQQQSLRGGQRMWSWSDNIERLAPDVFVNLLQLQMLGGALQSYSKQLEGVNLVASMGGYVNGSLMGYGKGWKEVAADEFEPVEGNGIVKGFMKEDVVDTVDEVNESGEKVQRDRLLTRKGAPVFEIDGKNVTLLFDDVVGIDPFGRDGKKGLFDLNDTLDKAGNILVGMNDTHIIAAMADPRVFFIIPWHASGNSTHVVMQMLSFLGAETSLKDLTDYTKVQEEKDAYKTDKSGKEKQIDQETIDIWNKFDFEDKYNSGIGHIPSGENGYLSAQQRRYRSLRDAIFSGTVDELPKKDRTAIMEDAFLSQVYNHVKNDVEAGEMTPGDSKFIYPYEYWNEGGRIETADENGERYLEYCRRLGHKPKFTGGYVKKTDTHYGNFAGMPGYWKLLIDRRMYDVAGEYQGLTPVTTEGYDPKLVDPQWTGENFFVTRVADDPGVDKMVDRAIAMEEENFPNGAPSVDYTVSREDAVTRYNDAVAAAEQGKIRRGETKKKKSSKAQGSNTMFRVDEEEQDYTPVFLSNAAVALDRIKMEKATPEQWVKMMEKEGGLKAGEDKWIGLGDWLRNSDRKTITKQEIADYIAKNQIQIADVDYSENRSKEDEAALKEYQRELDNFAGQHGGDYESAWDDMVDRYGDDFTLAFYLNGGNTLEPETDWNGDLNDAATYFLTMNGGGNARHINRTRLHYTTEGLDNKREIALVVPTVESWNEDDEIHFGDAGNGRAVAWVRFGDTTIPGEANPEEVQAFIDAQPKADEWEPMKNASGRTVYFPRGDRFSKDFIVERDGRYTVYLNEVPLNTESSLEDAVNSINNTKASYQPNVQKNKNVLVIDEIQSKRHQEGREKGYKSIEGIDLRKKQAEAKAAYDEYIDSLKEKYGGYEGIMAAGGVTDEENQRAEELNDAYIAASNAADKEEGGIAPAPFERNWHELAMKRMLRLAAEEGYDYVAWTTGEQQADRYNLSRVIDEVEVRNIGSNGGKEVKLYKDGIVSFDFGVDGEGNIVTGAHNGETLAEFVGKDMAAQVMDMKDREKKSVDEFKVGGEGMKGFYDEILPRFMNKYGKKWGVKVSDIELPNVEETGRIMHAVPVTQEMKDSVMEGQTMFRTEVDRDAERTKERAQEKLLNDRFNRQLGFTEETVAYIKKYGMMPKGYESPTYRLGNPFGPLLAAGMKDVPIRMTEENLLDASAQGLGLRHSFHKYEISDLKDLPSLLNHPIGVFRSGRGGYGILLDKKDKSGDNYYAFIRGNYAPNGGPLVGYEVISIYPVNKDGKRRELLESVAGYNDDLAWGDIKKITSWVNGKVSNLRSYYATTQDVAANIRKKFGNKQDFLKIDAENLRSGGNTRFRVTEEQDAEYMDAVNAGDMEKAGQMVRDAFKAAFPNTKVVDENGEPRVMYHGSAETFNRFWTTGSEGDLGEGSYFTSDRDLAETYTRRNGDNEWRIDSAIEEYFEEHPEKNIQDKADYKDADRWAEENAFKNAKLYSVYLNLENPRYTQMDDFKEDRGAYLIKGYYSDYQEGYDGIIDDTFHERFPDFVPEGALQVVAFEPNQIKLADPVTYDDKGNVIPLSERFNPENNDIRFRVDPETDSDGEAATMFRVREGDAPQKTLKVYKLMRLENGKLYPLFIDRDAEAIELGTWYDADSPDLAFLKKMPAGVFLVDAKNGTYTTLEDYKRERGEKLTKLPGLADVEEASRNGLRWVKITETENPQRRYEGENRKYENIGINGSDGVSTFAMRPGWHAGSLPTMRQIGKGAEKNLRDDKFVWVEGEISADKDYNEEAQGNPDKDIPTHIPTDGFYMKATNANKKASQADRVGWYVAGAFKPNRIISDSEARQVIDAWNAEHQDAPVEYDWPRESGREFNADTMSLEEGFNTAFRVDGTPEERVNYVEKQATDVTLDRMGQTLGIGIKRVGRDGMPEGHRTDKGYFDPTDDELTICMDNVANERDAIATVIHETVAYNGLRDLFGSTFRETMANIYATLDTKGRAWVNGYIRRNGLAFGDEGVIRGVEEYMANLADTGNYEGSVWGRIKEILGGVIDADFGTEGFEFTDREMDYILRASNEYMKNPVWMNTTAGKAKDTLWKRELGINETDPNKPTDPDGSRTMFRIDDTMVASDDYNAEMEDWRNKVLMENQNADLPVKLGIEKIMKELYGDKWKENMDAIPENADYLLRHNLSSSRAETEGHDFELFYFTPLLEQVRAIQSKLLGDISTKDSRQQAYERIMDYMYAVSALERNESKRNETGEQRDFAGITSLMGHPADEWQEAEADARAMIDAFKAEVGDDALLDELWDRVRACTDFSLDHAYEHGLLTREEYERLHGTDTKPRMWNYYLPLRGFSEKTAEELYDYSSFIGASHQNPVVKKMKGRWTKADNPLANILNIAESEIVQGNDNWARQALYNFTLNVGDNTLLTEVEPWFVKDQSTGKWSLAEPEPIVDPVTKEQKGTESLEEFEARMEALRALDTPLAKKGRRGLKVDNIIANKTHRNEHMISLKVGGIDKMIWVNGDPALAKAVSGFKRGQSMQLIRRASRALSNLFTTYSLDFTAKNLIRDTIYSRSALLVKEDKKYRNTFRKNWWSNFGYGAFAFPMIDLARRWDNGELQRKPESERTHREQMFIDFMHDGGQTGYTIINSVNEIKRSLERSMRRAGDKTGPITIPILGHYAKFVKTLNEAFELLTRFTAYETSRDEGRSGERAAYDAKEISVNFNRRGAQSGEGVWGNIASYLGATHYFYNAGIQGFDNYLRLYKTNWKKMTAITAGLMMMGVLTPLINSMLAGAAAGAGGGDDDWYWNLPEWVRRNNIILGTGSWYLAVPLPVEFRAPYGLGDISAQAFCYGLDIKGHKPFRPVPNRSFGKVAWDMISTASGLLPVNPIEGYNGNGNIGDAALRAVVPDATVFFVDWATNRDYTGRALWKENPFNDTVPKSQGAYASTPKGIVLACQKLAEVTEGGIDVPPGLVRDFMNNYGGGFFRAAEDVSKIITGIMGNDPDRPFRYDNMPFFSGFSGHIDEDRSNTYAQGALNEYKDISDGIVKKMNAICNTDDITAAMVYGDPEDIPEKYRARVNAWKTLHPKEYNLGEMYREGMNNKYKMKQYVKGEKKGQWYKSKEVEEYGVNTLKKNWKDLREYWSSMPDKTATEKSAKAEMELMVQQAWKKYYDAEANLADKLMNYEYAK